MDLLILLPMLLTGILLGYLFAHQILGRRHRNQLRQMEQQAREWETQATTWATTSRLHQESHQEEKSRLEKVLAQNNQQLSELNTQLLVAQEQRMYASTQAQAWEQRQKEHYTALLQRDQEMEALRSELQQLHRQWAEVQAKNKVLQEKLQTQKEEMEQMNQKFNTEFENIANKILETKSEKFTELNRNQLQQILQPLGENLIAFRKKVEEVYHHESKERFSLAEKVKELAQLNQTIGEEARNLTRALRGEAKTQGRWGEMILERILETSGLRKGEEYEMEAQLTDENGTPLRSDFEGKKMRPDAIVKYPDNRNVIIDSKVSLNAFERYMNTTDAHEQKIALEQHVASVKNHIVTLSTKGYDDYHKALDFVMLFIPSEPAYIAALQGDANLWNFAYEKRILLMNPGNLITSLKLIVDLWKREYQNRNAQAIADRGAKLYDKFVTFVSTLTEMGNSIDKAQKSYAEAYKQLCTGNDNLVLQTTKLRDLGIKNKKQLPSDLEEGARNRVV